MTYFLESVKSQRSRQLLGLFLLLALVVTVASRLMGFFLPDQFNEEFRILYHLDPLKTNDKDYAGQFLGQFPQPLLYVFTTEVALGLGMDLELFHRLLGAGCFLLFLGGSMVAALRLGGLFALTVVAFSAAQIVFYQQTSSATPHAFAFPLLAWMFVSLLCDRPHWGGVLTVLASLLYVPIAPLMGLMFAAHLLILRRGLADISSRCWLNLTWIAAVGLISVALVAHQLEPVDGYGAVLTPGEMVEEFPENGPQGRYDISVFEPVYHISASALGQFNQLVPAPLALSLFAFVGAFTALGLYNLRTAPLVLRPTLVFTAVSLLMFGFVFFLRPYVSYRFVLYPLFTVVPFLFVFGLNSILFRKQSNPRAAILVFFSSLSILFLTLGTAKDNQTNGWLTLNSADQEMLQFLSSTPEDSLIAAWPNQNASSLIPYIAGRPLLVDMKAHYPNYVGHLLEMRQRMFGVVDAYFATSPEALIKLNCLWDANYLVVMRPALIDGNASLSYFAPFDRRIKKRIEATVGKQLFLLDLPKESVVFSSGQYQIVNLEYFADRTDCDLFIEQSDRP